MKTRNRAIAAAGIILGIALGAGNAAAAEDDHQLCYKFKDVSPVVSEDISAQFSTANCKVKVKAAMWCVPFARNNDDDLRGTELGQTVCYKLKCEDTGFNLVNLILDTFIGTHGAQDVDFDKPKLVCAPVGFD